jgi:hypothetical protein
MMTGQELVDPPSSNVAYSGKLLVQFSTLLILFEVNL